MKKVLALLIAMAFNVAQATEFWLVKDHPGFGRHISYGKLFYTIDLSDFSDLEPDEMDDLIAQTVQRYPEVTWLILNFCQHTDQGLEYLSKLRNLQALNLHDCPNITNKGLGHLSGLITLERLILSENSQITDDGIRYLNSLSYLHSLDVSGCTQITGTGFQKLPNFKKLGALRLLILSKCNITDQGLKGIADLKNIRHLIMTNGTMITDAGMEWLSKLPQLETLIIMYAYQVTNQGLFYLSQVKSLQSLVFQVASSITDEGLPSLAYLRYNLLSLNLVGCSSLTQSGINELRRQMPYTKIEWFADRQSRSRL